MGLLAIGRAASAGASGVKTAAVEQVAQSDRQWTLIAVLPDGRIYVNFPRGSDLYSFPSMFARLQIDRAAD